MRVVRQAMPGLVWVAVKELTLCNKNQETVFFATYSYESNLNEVP